MVVGGLPLVNLLHQLVGDIKVEGHLTRKQLIWARRRWEAGDNFLPRGRKHRGGGGLEGERRERRSEV